jgi:hypothetical protein
MPTAAVIFEADICADARSLNALELVAQTRF